MAKFGPQNKIGRKQSGQTGTEPWNQSFKQSRRGYEI